MTQEKYDIFISYRREGGADKARTLKTELESRGYKVFLDFDELKDGVFDKRIMDAIDSSPIFMFLLTPNSLERCVNEDDWVRKEIEYAVDNRKHIVPINPDRMFGSLPDNMSEKINKGLGQHQFTDVMFGQLFKASINELIKDRVRPVLAAWGRENAAATKGATIHIETDLDCRILRFGKEIGMAQAGEYSEVKIPKGKHKLEFVGLENAADKYEHLLTVEDVEFEDYVEVKLLDKYNARKEKEAVEQLRIEAEKRAREKAEREAYLLSLPDDDFYWFEKDGKWGCKLISTGEIIIPLKYDFAGDFHEGLAMVRVGDWFKGNWGFVDKTGKEVIPLKYDGADPFREGVAMVRVGDRVNGKWGFIDKTGKEVIPLKYDDVWSFSEGLAAVRLYGKWGFIDKTGKEVIPLKYKDVGYFSEGLACVSENGDIYGYINQAGEWSVPGRYLYPSDFHNGIAKVTSITSGRTYLMDKKGNVVSE